MFWLIRSILIKGGWWNTKELLNLEWVVNKWKWVVVSPKIWCCPPPSTIRLSRVGGSFLENICDHTVMPQILWSAKYENQNFEKIFPFHRAYKNNLKNAKESLLLNVPKSRYSNISISKSRGNTKTEIFLKISKFSCADKKII